MCEFLSNETIRTVGLAAALLLLSCNRPAVYRVKSPQEELITVERQHWWVKVGFADVCCTGSLNGGSETKCFDSAAVQLVATSAEVMVECHVPAVFPRVDIPITRIK